MDGFHPALIDFKEGNRTTMNISQFKHASWLLKLALPGALALGIAAGTLSSRSVAFAQDMAPTTYVVQAGASGPANQDALIFAPQDVSVHQGDTITWSFGGFHNVHFEENFVELIVMQDVNGTPTPSLNPAVAFPTGESGASFEGGEFNTAIPILAGQGAFSLVMNAEPGTYTYFCDIHPGMAGTVTVVAADTAIPSPVDVTLQAGAEIGATIAQGMALFSEETAEYPIMPEGDENRVQAGAGEATSVQQFFPYTIVIDAGETVTWYIETPTREIHTVSWPSLYGQDFTPIEVEGGPPILAVGPALAPMTESGSEIGQGDSFSNVVTPDAEFSLTFTEPGVYPYVCNLHLGMQGTVVVIPAGM